MNGVRANCLVDTVAGSTILFGRLWEQIGEGYRLVQLKREWNLVDAQGSPLKSAALGEVKIQLGMHVFPASMMVVMMMRK